MFLIELLALAAVIVLCGVVPRARSTTRSAVLASIAAGYRGLALRRAWCVLGVCLMALAIQAGVGLLVHLPVPALHDEFSYLLASDTFAHGRLTNPTHPLWEHFESYNIIHLPSYQSKYPPGQGLALALGQALSGLPIVGMWIVVAAACGAVTWMAQAWMPARWALLAGLLSACNFRLLRYWGHSYMGGGLALLGGALLFGGLRRVVLHQRPRDAMLMASGAAILAATRPYEGLLAALCAATVLAIWCVSRQAPSWRTLATRVVLPATLIMLPALTWLGYYNLRLTGDPLKMPYQAWLETYSNQPSVTAVILRSTDEVAERGEPRRRVGDEPTDVDWQIWNQQRNGVLGKLARQWGFYVGLTLSPALLWVPWSARRRWMLFALVTCILVMAAIVMQDTHGHPQYAAPVGGLLIMLLVQGLRGMRAWSRSGPKIGRRLATALPLLAVAMCGLYVALDWIPQPVPAPMAWSLERRKLTEKLVATGDRHVVVVRYPEASESGIHWEEWVYNEARIDDSPVIWARDLGDDRNQELQSYYEQRKIWLLDLQRKSLRRYAHRSAPVSAPDAHSSARVSDPDVLGPIGPPAR